MVLLLVCDLNYFMSVCQLRLALCRPLRRPTATFREGRRVLYSRAFATEADSTHDLKPSIYGQPLFPSHPHLREHCCHYTKMIDSDNPLKVRPHELTPGIPLEEYELRRKELMDSLPSDSVVISVAAPVKYMSGSASYCQLSW